MNPWGWIAAYVVGFALLQLLVYRYVGQKTRGRATPPNPDAGGLASAGTPTGGDDTLTCDGCGAINAREPGIRFCRECASPIR